MFGYLWDAQGYGSEALQIASHWLKMAMGMLYDLACRSTKSLMRQLNVWVRGVWSWPLQWQGRIPLTSFVAAITPVQLGNGYGGYGSKLRRPGEYHKISQEPAAMDVYPNTYRKIGPEIYRKIRGFEWISPLFIIVWPIPTSETTPHCCYILHIAQLFSGVPLFPTTESPPLRTLV